MADKQKGEQAKPKVDNGEWAVIALTLWLICALAVYPISLWISIPVPLIWLFWVAPSIQRKISGREFWDEEGANIFLSIVGAVWWVVLAWLFPVAYSSGWSYILGLVLCACTGVILGKTARYIGSFGMWFLTLVLAGTVILLMNQSALYFGSPMANPALAQCSGWASVGFAFFISIIVGSISLLVEVNFLYGEADKPKTQLRLSKKQNKRLSTKLAAANSQLVAQEGTIEELRSGSELKVCRREAQKSEDKIAGLLIQVEELKATIRRYLSEAVWLENTLLKKRDEELNELQSQVGNLGRRCKQLENELATARKRELTLQEAMDRGVTIRLEEQPEGGD